MATSSLQRRRSMSEKNLITCREVLNTSSDPRIPKFFLKTMQSRSTNGCSEIAEDHKKKKKNKKKSVKPKNLFPKKVRYIFSGVFVNRKSSSSSSPKICSSNGELIHRISTSNTKSYLNGRNQAAGDSAPKFISMYKSSSLKEVWETEDSEGNQEKVVVDEEKRSPRLSFSSFLNKKAGLNFIKGKINKTNTTSSSEKSVESEPEEDGGGMELCKKRILMGRRCKPLTSTGTLRYDEDGVLIPDIIMD